MDNKKDIIWDLCEMQEEWLVDENSDDIDEEYDGMYDDDLYYDYALPAWEKMVEELLGENKDNCILGKTADGKYLAYASIYDMFGAFMATGEQNVDGVTITCEGDKVMFYVDEHDVTFEGRVCEWDVDDMFEEYLVCEVYDEEDDETWLEPIDEDPFEPDGYWCEDGNEIDEKLRELWEEHAREL